ncbi:MAG TPA: trehalose-phosphatase [Caulobacteraceae bacterium]|nr:trehalose-phosphatase [Caulobacteraceae bacterium]
MSALAPPPDQALADPPPLDPRHAALFADLDGTLAPIEATPDEVGPDRTRRRLLDALSSVLSGRLAVISGRGLADIDRVLEGRVPAVAAVHGLVRRTTGGRLLAPPADPRIREATAALRAFARSDPGLLVEDKSVAVALHFRAAPQAAEDCRALAVRLAEARGLVLQEGAMVVELRLPGPDKGAAVRAFMAEAPFAGATPVFLGDDLTDEAGFAEAGRLGGYGVVVGARRPTRATYALAGVAAARRWLKRSIEAAA